MIIDNIRKYGDEPYHIAVVHGGPGAPGEMAPVARGISLYTGVLEPLQSANTVDGQIEELHLILANYGNYPFVLIGFSWGAWLSYLVAAYYPQQVKKLILISSGPFEDRYVPQIMETRLSHLTESDRQEALKLFSALNSDSLDAKRLARFGELMGKADSFDPFHADNDALPVSPDIFQVVWQQASLLRSNGTLLEIGRKIQCPIVAIHGDYDPHPAEGVREPLSRVVKDFKFILLEKCGHHPWLERQAQKQFFTILKQEIQSL